MGCAGGVDEAVSVACHQGMRKTLTSRERGSCSGAHVTSGVFVDQLQDTDKTIE
jgi:hypothetical protein